MAMCPYCKKEINAKNVVSEKVSSAPFKFEKEMFSCPHCTAVLGFASRG